MSIKVGFARKEMTGKEPLPLAGFGNTAKRLSTSVLDGTFTTCISVTDDSDYTVLLISNDLINNYGFGGDNFTHTVRNEIENKLGIPANHIFVTCTHTHSGPDMASSLECMDRYREYVKQVMLSCVKESLEDRVNAKAFYGVTKTEKMNFVRHYICNDGSYIGDNHGVQKGKELVDHVTKADPSMQIIRFEREGKKDVLYINWRAHATITAMDKVTRKILQKHISADYPYYFTRYVEKQLDCFAGYYQGAAGNINPKSRFEEETPTVEPEEYGKILGDTLIAALPELKEVKTDSVSSKSKMIEFNINHVLEDKIDVAKDVYAFFTESDDRKKSAVYAREHGFASPYHAGAVITRSKMPKTGTIEVNAVRIGELGFAYAPGELFDTLSTQIKENSPFEKTIVMGYTNESLGYLPSKQAYNYGCYEADTTRAGEGTAERVAENLLEMLNELK